MSTRAFTDSVRYLWSPELCLPSENLSAYSSGLGRRDLGTQEALLRVLSPR